MTLFRGSLLHGSLLKIARRPATRVIAVTPVALVLLCYLGLALAVTTMPPGDEAEELRGLFRMPEAYGTLAVLLLTFGGLAAAAWAGAVAGAEWTWNTFRTAVARGTSRPAYVGATIAAAMALALLGWGLAYAAGLAAMVAGGALAGTPAGVSGAGLAVLPAVVLAGWWAVCMEAVIAFAAAFIARSQVAGLGVVVALYVGEQFASIVIPADVLRFAPVTAASTLVAEAARSGDVVLPLVVTTSYLALAAGAAMVVARRSEVH